MNSKAYFLGCLFFILLSLWRGPGMELLAQAPVYLWAQSAGKTDSDYGYSCSTDPNGNIIVTGNFKSSTITFGTTTLTNNSAGYYDIFIVKCETG